ncbi:hypothetical protein NP493_536g00005 [Ridgeia piscesae]|uniref:Uncharacterized protein n=1 Tax=Ridgeia piscesae TaxID=27915 RepID=A0AAD9KVY2_RIDPI|nr:hypothetical protein NP493_536g00005 [Ridgeia piscesae]
MHRPTSCVRFITLSRCSSCSVSVLPNTTMSSAIATTPGRPSNVWSTFFWNTSCAETCPNGKRRKQYRPYSVLNVVSTFDSSSHFTFQYRDRASSIENTLAPSNCGRMSSRTYV